MLLLLLLLLAGCSQKTQNTAQSAQQIIIIDETQVMSSFPEYKQEREKLVDTVQKLGSAKEELIAQAGKEREKLSKLQDELEKLAKTDVSKLPAKQKAFEHAREKSTDVLVKLQQNVIKLEETAVQSQADLDKLVHKFKERNQKALAHIIRGTGGSVLVIGLPETRVLHCDSKLDKTDEMIKFLHNN